MPPPTQSTKDVAVANGNNNAGGGDPNNVNSHDGNGGGSSTGWWIKWIGIGILVLGLCGLAFYTYRLKGQLDASKAALEISKKDTASICTEFEKLKVEMAKCHTQLEELKKKAEEQECIIEKNKKKNKDLKNKIMDGYGVGKCDPVTGLCPVPLPSQHNPMSKMQRATEVSRE